MQERFSASSWMNCSERGKMAAAYSQSRVWMRKLPMNHRFGVLSFLMLIGWVVYLGGLFESSIRESGQFRPLRIPLEIHSQHGEFAATAEFGIHRGTKQIEQAEEEEEEQLSTSENLGAETEEKSSNTKELTTRTEPPVQFMLVTAERPNACKSSQGSHMLMKSYKNKVDYCNLHGCKVWYSLECWHPDFRGTWARYPLLKRLMQANPEVRWFMWMDGDAIFTDMSFSMPFEEYNEWETELIVPGYWDKVYGENPDWVGLNAGVFLIRNSNWSMHFLDDWIDLGNPENEVNSTRKINHEIPSRPQDWGADDQSALVYLLRHLSAEDRERTFLELRYSLHGYWELIVDKYERFLADGNSQSKQWPFVTHFCGCNLCGGEYASSNASRCVTSFERAYHFANNQILGLAGMRHTQLNSSAVQPVNSSEQHILL